MITLMVIVALILAIMSCFPIPTRVPLLAVAVVLLALVETLRLGLLP